MLRPYVCWVAGKNVSSILLSQNHPTMPTSIILLLHVGFDLDYFRHVSAGVEHGVSTEAFYTVRTTSVR